MAERSPLSETEARLSSKRVSAPASELSEPEDESAGGKLVPSDPTSGGLATSPPPTEKRRLR